MPRPLQSANRPMSRAARWWAFTLLIAAVSVGVVQGCLRSRPAQVGVRLVRAEIPETWSTLPITARLTGDLVSILDTGCGPADDVTHHEGRLGRFRVRWSVYVYKGIDAGGRGWTVDDPDLPGSCPPPRDLKPGTPVHLERPDTLREDAAAGLYVLEGYGQPMGACREQQVVTSPAYEAPTRVRIVASMVAAALALAASEVLRRQRDVG